MAVGYEDVIVSSVRGGRNGFDPPHALPENQAAELLNVDFYGGATLCRKRPGAAADVLTFSAGGPFTGTISFLGRHVPGSDPTLAELWAIDDAATPVVGRKAASTQYAQVTLKDAITGNAWDVTGASINGKYFLSYKSGQNRLHAWDPVSATVRRTGMAVASAAPTVANTGAGAYAATLRYYRVRFSEQQTGVTVRLGDLGPSVSFTPSGGGAAARVTQPTPPGEGETHWQVEGSTDNISFFLLGTIVIGTTTYDDSAATGTYSTNPLSASAGTYTVQKSYKFIAVDANRLLGFGSWTSTDKQNRIEFSAVVGSLNVEDAERVPTNNFIDLDETDSGFATGLVGPMNMAYYAFKDRQVWRLTPTGDPTTPYLARPISKIIGAVSHHSIKVAEDDIGNPAIYWMSHKGPYRYGRNGLESLSDKGGNVRDLIVGPTKTLNVAATHVVAHTLYHSDRQQLWMWIATGSANDPDEKLVYDINAKAWVRHTGESAKARCSVLFSNTQGTSMSRDLKPYIGYVTSSVEALVVGGGGGGGGYGGGAGGGYRYDSGHKIAVSAYSVTVGAGGAASVSSVTSGSTGGNSVFDTLTADGGGGGGGDNGNLFVPLRNSSAGSTDQSTVGVAIDGTGADLLVGVLSDFGAGARATISDSTGDTWTGLTSHQSGTNARCTIWYVVNPSQGTHTLTITGAASSFPAIAVAAFLGNGGAGFDVENGANGTGITTLATGSVTPAAINALCIAGLTASADGGAAPTIDGGYTVYGNTIESANHESAGLAYLIETARVATNPTWTNGASTVLAASMAVFKNTVTTTAPGLTGGSGGGGGVNVSSAAGIGNVGGFSPTEGGNGGLGTVGVSQGSHATSGAGGGGGGAFAAGAAAIAFAAGIGGDGLVCPITGTAFAGGGGGGGQTGIPATGGAGGGGAGASTPIGASTPGTDGTGGGGGGGNVRGGPDVGSAGGKGIVIIKRQTAAVAATGGTLTTSGAFSIHTFTSNGTFTVTAVTATTAVFKCDTSASDDAGIPFQAYVLSRQMAPWGFGKNGAIDQTILMATANAGVSITQTLTTDYSAQPVNVSTVLLTPTGTETRVLPNFEASQSQAAGMAQFQWGDAAAVSNAWQLDAVRIKWRPQEDR